MSRSFVRSPRSNLKPTNEVTNKLLTKKRKKHQVYGTRLEPLTENRLRSRERSNVSGALSENTLNGLLSSPSLSRSKSGILDRKIDQVLYTECKQIIYIVLNI